MSIKKRRFDVKDTIRFIEIYRKHECLWNSENVNYKSREIRHVALTSFAEEIGIEGYGPKEIKLKIKQLRTQFNGERKKILASKRAESNSGNVYKPKHAWYNLLDSFLLKTAEDRETTLYLNENSDNTTFQCNSDNSEDIEKVNVTTHVQVPSKSPEFQTVKIPSTSDSAHSSYDTLDDENRDKIDDREDDLESFGKYVTSSLRTLSAKNCILAQDKIQNVLSKYKMRNLYNRRISRRRKSCSSNSDVQ